MEKEEKMEHWQNTTTYNPPRATTSCSHHQENSRHGETPSFKVERDRMHLYNMVTLLTCWCVHCISQSFLLCPFNLVLSFVLTLNVIP